MKPFIVVVSPDFQDIKNKLGWFHPHKIVLISFFINTVSYHPQIWFEKNN
jgi:hypothetical protein